MAYIARLDGFCLRHSPNLLGKATPLTEVSYLKKYDLLNNFIKNYIDMPDMLADLLIRFLNQNGGKLSKRAREKEFNQLTGVEVQAIERKYDEVFHIDDKGMS